MRRSCCQIAKCLHTKHRLISIFVTERVKGLSALSARRISPRAAFSAQEMRSAFCSAGTFESLRTRSTIFASITPGAPSLAGRTRTCVLNHVCEVYAPQCGQLNATRWIEGGLAFVATG